jgi:hypothetical protein
MSRIFVGGTGAVSPAGWGTPALRDAIKTGTPLPAVPLDRPGWKQPLRCHPVPHPTTRPAFLAHPRLRRTSPITHYAAAAALEALSTVHVPDGRKPRVGLIVCLDGGCVQYSCRFFEEVLKDPATASPVLFPETVFAALGSSVAALLPDVPLLHTLLGDSANFLHGVAMASEWLLEKRVDTALVVGAEEINWVLADALGQLDRSAELAAGAGAIALVGSSRAGLPVELTAITNAHTYSRSHNRAAVAQAVRRELSTTGEGDFLCDSRGRNQTLNRAEEAAWTGGTGTRVSPRQILGEGLIAAAAWQCVLAADAVLAGGFSRANVSLAGTNQQAIGAQFARLPGSVAS